VEERGRRKSFCLDLSPGPSPKKAKSSSPEVGSCDYGETGCGSGTTSLGQTNEILSGTQKLRNSRSESVLSGLCIPQKAHEPVCATERRAQNAALKESPQQERAVEGKSASTNVGLLILPRDQQGRRLLPSQLVGVVPVPEYWSGELHLKEWIETKQVEKGLRPRGLQAAREAMILDGLKPHSASLPTRHSMQMNPASTVISA
jgi:hypothetical protein